MNIDKLTIGEAKALAAMFGGGNQPLNHDLIGKYVVVRCREAGVHAGRLASTDGRSCVLKNARRLWYWKVPAGKGDFLNAIANHGVHEDSKLGEAVLTLLLTENCEIIECTRKAQDSIEGQAIHNG